MFRYHDIRASTFCRLREQCCNSKSILKLQNDDSFCSLCCILAHLHKVDNHRDRVSNFAKSFHKLDQGDILIPMKIKDITSIEQLNKLNKNVFEFPLNYKTFSPKCNNKNYYEEQIDLLLYENHFCLITNLHNVCRKKENYTHT